MITDNKVQIHRKFGIEKDDFYELTIDGYIVEGVIIKEIQSSQIGQQDFVAYSHESSASDKISSIEIWEFLKANLFSISFENWAEIGILAINVEVEFDTKNKKTHLEIHLSADLLLWNRNYTFVDYFNEFERLLNANKLGELSDNGVGDNIFVHKEIPLQNKLLSEEISPYLERIIENHYETLKNLDSAYSDNVFLTTFNFPAHLKIPCEQYLLYFAQFLQDLGINATPDLKEEAGKVLFSVTPADDVEALDNIREALAVYLNLPSSPVVYDDSFAAMRLQQQIENLQHSQRMMEREIRSSEIELRLAQTVIESQDKVILQKDTIIEQQNKVIEQVTSKSIMMDSVDIKEELEEIYEGVKVGESKWLKELSGIGLNPAKFIKSVVKNTFGKDGEKNSILGLDEET
jgi:hypothetical protein